MIKNIKEITIKELKSQFDHIGGYLLILIFLALLYFLFLKPFFILQAASVRNMFSWIPWLFTVLIPAITMGSFAREYENQTLEYLMTKPISKTELIIGKIMGSFKFIAIAVLLTMPIPYAISRIGNLDWGETIAGYIATMLLALALCSVGVAISSTFKNQITSFITSAILIFMLNIISSDYTSINLPLNVANFLGNLSTLDHFQFLSRGVIQFSDVVYFILFVIASFTVTYLNLSKIQQSKVGNFYKNNILTVLVAAVVFFGVYASSQYAVGRIDLTSNKKYTLSEVTRQIIRQPGQVTIQAYATREVPLQFQYRYNETKNLLDDYNRSAAGNIKVEYLNPRDHQQTLDELGIQPFEFRVYGEDQIQAQRGYLAVVIKNEDSSKTEVIPNIDDQILNNLEYELTKVIFKIKNEDKSQIAVASGNGERNIFEEYSQLQRLLGSTYEFRTVVFPAKTETTGSTEKPLLPSLSEYKTLLIANPTGAYTEESLNKIKEFSESGGNIIYLADMLDINNQLAIAEEPPEEQERGNALQNLGIKINKDLVYDLRNFGMININSPQGTLPMRYPLFIFNIKPANLNNPSLPDNVILGWGSTFTLENPTDWETLFQTSPDAGKFNDAFNVRPDQNFPQEGLSSKPMIIAKNLDKEGGKIIAISTARAFDDDFLVGFPQNAVLAESLFEIVSENPGFSTIRARDVAKDQFFRVDQFDKNVVSYGGPVSSVLLLGAIGVQRVIRKKVLLRKYQG